MQVNFELNGRGISVDVEPSELLSNLVREKLGLTGTHIGCDTAQCGACVVHVDGVSVKSCTTLVVTLSGAKVTTIEGLIGDDNELHPMQQAFHDNHGLQCGFCTPGMIMSAIEFAHQHPDPTEAEARTWLVGNICRCTGYQNIIASVLAGCVAMQRQRRPQL
jgi:aerobic carbon-monoxide dehydrogenase small subunit